MKQLILGFLILTLGACTSIGGPLKPQTAEESVALEQECGRRPISKIMGSKSHRLIIYRACKRDTLNALGKEKETEKVLPG